MATGQKTTKGGSLAVGNYLLRGSAPPPPSWVMGRLPTLSGHCSMGLSRGSLVVNPWPPAGQGWVRPHTAPCRIHVLIAGNTSVIRAPRVAPPTEISQTRLIYSPSSVCRPVVGGIWGTYQQDERPRIYVDQFEYLERNSWLKCNNCFNVQYEL